MTVKEYIATNGWDLTDEKAINKVVDVNIGFINNEGFEDETQFSIDTLDVNELAELFEVFCKENNFRQDTVTYICIVGITDDDDC